MNYILSKLSHELRNPLTTISSAIQLIETQHPEVKDYKYWANIQHDIEYMNRLLDEFSDFSKSERLEVSTFSLRTLLEHVSLSFATMIVDTQVEYTAKIDPSINQITGDRTKLQEVFLNLLKNAFEAAKPDKSVYFKVSLQEDKIIAIVRDTGCGIPETQLSSIFEPFVTYKPHGTGLGLALCKQIVNAHGGLITVESEVNVGSTFTVFLPLNM